MPPANLGQLLVQMQYPGMTWVESQITRAWISRHGAEYDELMFNVRLGDGAQIEGEFTPEIIRMATLISQKRADMVARTGDQVDIVEVKVRIAFPVIGQLLGYRGLWQRDHPEMPVRRLVAVGRSVVPDMGPIIEESGVIIETFPREE